MIEIEEKCSKETYEMIRKYINSNSNNNNNINHIKQDEYD